MDTQKKEVLCQLNEIGILLCKLTDEKKLKHCEKKINLLHQYLKKKKSKTMRKKKSNLSKDTPVMIDDIDKSVNMNNSTQMSKSIPESISEPVNTKVNSDLNLTEVSSIYPSVNDPSVNETPVNDSSVNSNSVNDPTVNDPTVNDPSVKFTSSIKPLNI